MTWLVPTKDQIAQDNISLAGSERSQKDRKLNDGRKGKGGGGRDKDKEGDVEETAMEDEGDKAKGGPAHAAAQGAKAVRTKRGGEAYHAKADPKLKLLLAVLIKQVVATTQ